MSANFPYPPASGGAIRTYGILKGLHAAGHRITLLTFGDGSLQDTTIADFCDQVMILPKPERRTIERVRDLLLSNQADIARRLYNDTMRDVLQHLLDESAYDLIQFEGIEVACYLPIARATDTRAKLCFDTFNAEADLQRMIYEIDRTDIRRAPQALYSYIQSQRIKHYEGELCRMADLVIAVSREDAASLRAYRSDEQVAIVPSGIFTQTYAQPTTPAPLQQPSLIFTGKMDYRPNVDAMLWFADEILPQVDDAHLTIVGQHPHARIQHLPQRANITLTGWVDAIPPYLHAADVYVAPLRMGSGTRLKILEAMASGCAIVATSTAAAGLDDPTEAMLIANSAADFAGCINALLSDPTRRAELGARAQAYVKAHYDWSVLIPRLLTAYQEVGLG